MAGGVKPTLRPFSRDASLEDDRKCIRPTQRAGPEGGKESDLRLNLVCHRPAEWAVPRFGSDCVGVDR
jgi:hypothetical protein